MILDIAVCAQSTLQTVLKVMNGHSEHWNRSLPRKTRRFLYFLLFSVQQSAQTLCEFVSVSGYFRRTIRRITSEIKFFLPEVELFLFQIEIHCHSPWEGWVSERNLRGFGMCFRSQINWRQFGILTAHSKHLITWRNNRISKQFDTIYQLDICFSIFVNNMHLSEATNVRCYIVGQVQTLHCLQKPWALRCETIIKDKILNKSWRPR